MENLYRWLLELAPEEIAIYPLDIIKVGFDRVYGEWITLDQVFFCNTSKYRQFKATTK